MSIKELQRFSKDLEADEALRSELTNLGSNEEVLIKFAQGKGYDFNQEDLLQAKKQYESGELTDTELDNVVGARQAVFITHIFVVGS